MHLLYLLGYFILCGVTASSKTPCIALKGNNNLCIKNDMTLLKYGISKQTCCNYIIWRIMAYILQDSCFGQGRMTTLYKGRLVTLSRAKKTGLSKNTFCLVDMKTSSFVVELKTRLIAHLRIHDEKVQALPQRPALKKDPYWLVVVRSYTTLLSIVRCYCNPF